jgi:soluble lytic murein transglycosylase
MQRLAAMPMSKLRSLAVVAAVSALLLVAGPAAANPIPPVANPAKASPAANTAPTLLKKPSPPPAEAAREAEYVARLDVAIAPVRDHALTGDDATRLGEAVAAYASNAVTKGQQLRDQITDPLARKMVDWHRLRAGSGEPEDYRTFLEANPNWPDRALLTQRFEEALFTQGGSSQAIKDAFKGSEPKSGVGFAALASAHLAEGDETRAQALAAGAWRHHEIPATLETGFLARFGRFLTEADHKWRLDRLLVADLRWTSDRSERAAVARRLLPLLSKPERQKAEARLATFVRAANAQQLMRALSGDMGADWGLAYQRVQMLRRAGKHEEAWKILLSAPTDPALIVSPDAWWAERRANAYEALSAGKPRVAFDLVRQAGPLGVNALKDQTFLAGWLTLRFLNDARSAQTFFRAMRSAADGPISLAKSQYWQGRSAEAGGDRTEAEMHYRTAAQYFDTFHGQLAHQKIESGTQHVVIRMPAAPTAEEIARFTGLDVARAAVLARKSSLDAAIVRIFLTQLQRSLKTEGEVAMAAHLAEALGQTQMAVRIGKAAMSRGFNLVQYAYPLHAFPAYAPLRPPPEAALLVGIARQESEFNGQIVSGAGARGILQVMPVTARHVCKDYKIKCDLTRLLNDASYNTMIASAYIGDRLAEFSGSYVLAVAGYNAGPGRVRQWIREFGDPRDPHVDPIDWIHRIPFEETRDYVQKVLSNTQVYRARLGEEKPLRIAEDLRRAQRSTHRSIAASTAGASTSEPKEGPAKQPERPRGH